jgi:hypothetical protein
MPHGLWSGPTGSKSALQVLQNSLPRSSLFSPGFGAIGIRANESISTGALVNALLGSTNTHFRRIFDTIYSRVDIVFDLIREKNLAGVRGRISINQKGESPVMTASLCHWSFCAI